MKECPGPPDRAIVVHSGRSVTLSCDIAGRRHRGPRVHGDIMIVPAGVPSRWESAEDYTELSIRVPARAFLHAAEAAGLGSQGIEIVDVFRTRDPQMEHVAWALRAELEAGLPNGPLFTESLGLALATHLQRHHSARPVTRPPRAWSLEGRRLTRVLAYIEDNLSRKLSLNEIAGLVGLSASHCNAAFRRAMGVPLHQYVIQQRVARAKAQLLAGHGSISEVATATGFANPSHLAYHMRRLVGVSPRILRASAPGRPIDRA